MEQIKPDIIATIRFFSTREGGRKSVLPKDRFGCIFTFEGNNFDCFLFQQSDDPVKPGDTVKMLVKFLYPELIKHKLVVGSKFSLRDYRVIAEGWVENILDGD